VGRLSQSPIIMPLPEGPFLVAKAYDVLLWHINHDGEGLTSPFEVIIEYQD